MNGTALSRAAPSRRRDRSADITSSVDAKLAALGETCEGLRDDVALLAEDLRSWRDAADERLRKVETTQAAGKAVERKSADLFGRTLQVLTFIAIWSAPFVTLLLAKLFHV